MKKCSLLLPLLFAHSCVGPLGPDTSYEDDAGAAVDMGTCTLPEPLSGPATVTIAYLVSDAALTVAEPDPDANRQVQVTNGVIDGAPQSQVVSLISHQDPKTCTFYVTATVLNPPTLIVTSEQVQWNISMNGIPGVLR
jgi:hypothetical protein